MTLSQYSDQLPANYRLRLSGRARALRITIRPTGLVEVVVPRGYDLKGLTPLLEARRPWIEQHLQRLGIDPQDDATHLPVPPSQIHLAAIDRLWRVDYATGSRNRVTEQGGWLRVSDSGDSGWRQGLLSWLRRRARGHLEGRLAHIAAQTGIDYGRVTIRAQRSRWGSCSSRGGINLNQGLMFLEPEVVDYLLLHELCHRVQMNHSADFWALVAQHMPDYRRHDRSLRGAMARLPRWALPD